MIDEKKVIDEKAFAKKFNNFGPSMLVGQRPMESLLSVCLSVRLSVCPSVLRPSLSFLKIGSLFFSDIIHDAS